MPLSGDDLICPKFQPNIFDSSRCHDCLRQKHLHAGTDTAPQVSPGTDSSQGQQPVAEEKDSSTKEDSDAQSVVSSYCDVSGGQRGYEESSLHILSPDCQLYLCDGDDDEDSTDSQDHCDYPAFFYSTSADDDYHSVHHRSTYTNMTRLDPPPHRPNPRAWMEESRSGDSFGRHSVGSRGDRDRESGYLSLGKAGGIRSFRDQSPPAPFRHSERGHPIPSTRSPEPKDTIPFRNRDLGVPSHRRGTELQYEDYLEEIPPPEPTPLERSIEVEAQVGPRSPSPTPFKQAEALASNRKGFSGSYSRAKSPSPYSSSQQQSRRGASLSRSSSPARSTSSHKRSESVTLLNSRNFGSSAFTQGRDHRSRSPPSQNSYGRGLDPEGAQRNFRSIASSVSSKSLSSSYADLRGSLRKAESTTSLAPRGLTSRSTSPSRRGYDTPGQSMLRKSETNGTLCGHNRDTRSSSSSRRGNDIPGQSMLRKSETNGTLGGHNRDTRSSSSSRRGNDIPGQSMLRKSETNGTLGGHNRDTRSSSPSRRGYDTPGQSMLRKSETNGTLGGHNRDTRSSSPSKRGYDTPGQSMLRKSDTRSSTNAYGLDRRNTSPSRTSYDHQGQSLSQKTEKKTSSYGRDSPSPSRKGFDSTRPSIKLKSEAKVSLSRSSSPSRNGYDTSSQSVLRFTETSRPKHCQGQDSRSPSPSRRGYDTPRQSLQQKSETDSSRSLSGRNSRSSSPSKRGTDSSSQSALRKTVSYDARPNATSSYPKKTVNSHGKSDSNPSPGSWRGSSHSLCSPPTSRSPSPSRKTSENRPLERSQRSSSAVLGNGRNGSRSSSCSRHVTEKRSLTPEARKSSGQNQSQSPHMRRLTSSQSSMDSTESSHLSGGSTGFNKEEYAMMADLPKVKTVFQREGPNHLGRLESHHSGEERLYKPASHSHTKNSYNNWDSGGDHQDGRLIRTHSSTSLHFQRSCSPTMEEVQPWKGQQRSPRQSQRMSQGRPSVYFSPSVESAEESPIEQPDLLNFKKGWMSKLDENGEWKKHWFVLTDAGLRYYRDSGAEEKDDLDGEIDLKSCVKVSEYDVEKNYGFQIHTREAVVTLSAMTAGIRRNWIEVLRKSVRPSSSPDLTQLPDGNSDKENSRTRSLSSARRHHSQSQSHADASTSGSTQRRFDYVELSPVATPGGLGSSTQREAGEGQVREGGSWREEEQRSRESTASQWEAVLSRKGPGQGGDSRQRIEEEIERKWAEFERLPLKEMRSLPATLGSRASSGPLASEALQREVASLRQQLEHLKKGGEGGGVGGGETGHKKEEEEGGGGGGPRRECGPLASCGRSLRAMELAHRHALEELQRQHVREVQELQQERDRLLQEETQATEKAMEVLKKAHREELERELERARRLGSTGTDAMTLSAQQRAETATLQRELQGLSERYSQKCLELKRVQQDAEEHEREASRREREMQLLRQENQDLQARLTEEINRMRSLVTGQGVEGIADANRERKSCELEVLLRVKENEVLYLQKEISCLRNELQCLNSEKRSACARYKEVHEELSSMKSRSEREIQSLREHLKLAMAALQEGQRLGNSLEH